MIIMCDLVDHQLTVSVKCASLLPYEFSIYLVKLFYDAVILKQVGEVKF